MQYEPEGSTNRAIANHVEAAIHDGTIQAGHRLPAIRTVARAQGTSPATVAAAYQHLKERGLVVTRGRRGTLVADAARPPFAFFTPAPAGAKDLRDGNPAAEFVPALAPFLPDLSAPLLPRRSEDRNEPRLLDLAASRFAEDGVTAAHLGVVGGAQDAIERILLGHVVNGDSVAVEDPTYPPVASLLASLRLTPLPVAVDEAGVRPDALARALQTGVGAVILTPRGQNPTGASLTPGRAAALVALLKHYPDVLVVEDDYLADVSPVGAVSVAADPDVGRWAVIRSASKSLGPDLRLAVVAGDETTIARMETRQVLGTGWVSTVLQRLAAAMWSSPEVAALHQRATAVYQERREALVAALAEQGIDASPGTGLNVWVRVESEGAIVERLLARGWAVSAGDVFRLEADPGIRVTTARLSPDDARDFALDLRAAMSERTGRPTY